MEMTNVKLHGYKVLSKLSILKMQMPNNKVHKVLSNFMDIRYFQSFPY